MSHNVKDVRLLIKWSGENAWDVISPSDAGLSITECKNSTDFIGETRNIYFDGSIFEAKILEIGPEQQMIKKCSELFNQFYEIGKINALNRRKVSVPHKRCLQSDESDEDCNNSVKLQKKAKPEEQKNLNKKLKKIVPDQSHTCCISKKLLKAANEKIASLKKENAALKSELEAHRTLKNIIEDVKKIQSEAKYVLKYSERCSNALILNNYDEEQLTQPGPVALISVSTGQVELVPGTTVFIDQGKLDYLNAEAAGDGCKLARSLLTNLFDPSELANHSITGKSSNAHKCEPKPPIDPTRLAAILRYVSIKTNANIRKVRASIANKIKEITHSYSKQEGNASC